MSIVLVAALASAAFFFRHALIGWFTGASMGGNEGSAVTVQAGPYTLAARLDPDPPQQQGNALVLEVKDAKGAPVEDAASPRSESLLLRAPNAWCATLHHDDAAPRPGEERPPPP